MRFPLVLRQVVGVSMLPTLPEGRVVLGTGWYKKLQKNDLVIIKHEGHEKIKRIHDIRPGEIYVRGDNAQQSADSRHFGWIAATLVRARIVWPRPDISSTLD